MLLSYYPGSCRTFAEDGRQRTWTLLKGPQSAPPKSRGERVERQVRLGGPNKALRRNPGGNLPRCANTLVAKTTRLAAASNPAPGERGSFKATGCSPKMSKRVQPCGWHISIGMYVRQKRRHCFRTSQNPSKCLPKTANRPPLIILPVIAGLRDDFGDVRPFQCSPLSNVKRSQSR